MQSWNPKQQFPHVLGLSIPNVFFFFSDEAICVNRNQSDLWNTTPSNTGQKIDLCQDGCDGSKSCPMRKQIPESPKQITSTNVAASSFHI